MSEDYQTVESLRTVDGDVRPVKNKSFGAREIFIELCINLVWLVLTLVDAEAHAPVDDSVQPMVSYGPPTRTQTAPRSSQSPDMSEHSDDEYPYTHAIPLDPPSKAWKHGGWPVP